MLISIITLFPEIFESVFGYSIINRAQKEGKVSIRLVNLRDFGIGRHKTVDDKPYGGGVGMLLRVDVVARAIEAAKKRSPTGGRRSLPAGRQERVLLLDPKGEVYNQEKAEILSHAKHLILLCGHYEGFDARIKKFVDMSISIGDYVLSGGEIPAMVVTETVTRLVKGVLRKSDATQFESFSTFEKKRILEYPQYTLPRVYKRLRVPHLLLSGDHKKIIKLRTKQAVQITKKLRPELLISTRSVVRE